MTLPTRPDGKANWGLSNLVNTTLPTRADGGIDWGEESMYARLTPEAIERVINTAIRLHNKICNGPNCPVYYGPWSIQKSFHKRRDMLKAIAVLCKMRRRGWGWGMVGL